MAFLDMDHAVFTYPGRAPVVNGVSWRMQAGEFHCLLGRSGCGKTTLLKLAAGLLRPQSGKVLLNGGELAAPGPQLGFMFQAPTLLEWLTVLDNVLLPVSLQRKPTAQDTQRALQLLEQLGLSALARNHPRQLSGGQQSRVALARALILEPPLLLLDEPFAALDALTRLKMQRLIGELCQAHGPATLLVTHDVEEAILLADRILVLREGRIGFDTRVRLPHPRRAGGEEFDKLRDTLLAELGVPQDG